MPYLPTGSTSVGRASALNIGSAPAMGFRGSPGWRPSLSRSSWQSAQGQASRRKTKLNALRWPSFHSMFMPVPAVLLTLTDLGSATSSIMRRPSAVFFARANYLVSQKSATQSQAATIGVPPIPAVLPRARTARILRNRTGDSIMVDVRRGLIMVNTGPGKGKTTAAMGTGLRAVGNGLKVLMLQFLKGSWHYGELDAVKAFGDNFVMKQMGRGFVKVGGAETDPEDVRMVDEAWAEAEQAILSGAWDLVILDEINYAISYKMLDPEKVVAALKKKPEMVHVILTGRNAHPSIVEIADTVTEMKEVKHAYTKGIEAQRGIEY